MSLFDKERVKGEGWRVLEHGVQCGGRGDQICARGEERVIPLVQPEVYHLKITQTHCIHFIYDGGPAYLVIMDGFVSVERWEHGER